VAIREDRIALQAKDQGVILLDTNALIWVHTGHPRGRPLLRASSLYISPVSLLELAFLEESKRVRLAPGARDSLNRDPRWTLDNPMSTDLFDAALDLSWTRDPFDRLIVAHARMRGWRLATGDRTILAKCPEASVVAL
jgi:PIN domain nuclease of toxin-antitoxin system